MEILKKALKITGIIAAIFLGIIILLIILMAIFPNFKIFGKRYINNPDVVGIEQKYAVAENEAYILIINTQVYDIQITENRESNELKLNYKDQQWGFVDILESQLTIKAEENIIEARMLEKDGWVFGSGIITVQIPVNSKISLNINTKKGDIFINHGHLNSLTVNMQDGDFEWKAEDLVPDVKDQTPAPANTDSNQEEQNQENNNQENNNQENNNQENNNQPNDKVKYKVVPVLYIELESLNIFSNNAHLNFKAFEGLTITKKFIINSNKLSLNLKKLNANTEINCPDLELNIVDLSDISELRILSQGGNIKITNLECVDKATIVTGSSDIEVQKINCLANFQTTSGNISIGEANADIVLETTSGAAKVIKVNENVSISTKSGGINISEYYKKCNIVTKTGSIELNNKGEENNVNKTTIIQDSGNINITTANNEIDIKSNNGSTIKAAIRRMCLNEGINHKIYNTNGTTNIYIMAEITPFKYRAVGQVSGELSSHVDISPSTDFLTYVPNNYSGDLSAMCTINVEGGTVKFGALYE